MGQPLPLMEIANCFLSSTRQLSDGVAPGLVLRSLAPQIANWNAEEALRPRLVHTTSMLPPADETAVAPERVAQALYEDARSFSDVEDEFARNVFSAAARRLQGLIGSSHPPAANGPFVRRSSFPPEESDSVERQMVEALRLYVLRAMHDANNTLMPIQLSIQEAKDQSLNLLKLAEAYRHMLPEGVRDAMVNYVADIDKRVDEVGVLGTKTAAFIRNVQSLIASGNQSEADFIRIRRLFEKEGLVPQIALILVDLLTGLQEVESNIKTLRQMAKEYGHHVPGPVLQTGLDFLSSLDDSVATYRHLATHIVGMFRFLQKVAEDINGAQPEVVDLNSFLSRQTIAMVMGKGIEVFLSQESEPCLVFGVPIHIWQILINLFSNARDAMKDFGALTVTTGFETLDETGARAMKADLIKPQVAPGEFVRLRVEDTGHGIPDDILDKVFDRNFSGKQSSGLGLDATLTIVMQMGGFILVDTATATHDRRRRGTAFTLYLPRRG